MWHFHSRFVHRTSMLGSIREPPPASDQFAASVEPRPLSADATSDFAVCRKCQIASPHSACTLAIKRKGVPGS